GVENAPDASFCGDCRAALGASLQTSESHPSPVQPREVTGERRHLTALFCDLVGSSGIAAQLDPANVVVAARTQGEVDAVAAEIKELGRRGFALTIDLMKLEDIKPMVKKAAQLLDGIDILVNNAGGSLATNPADLVKTLQENLTLNLVQVACTIDAALPYMIKQKWGRIINTGSGAATRAGMCFRHTPRPSMAWSAIPRPWRRRLVITKSMST